MKHQDFTTRKGKEYISVTTALEIIHNKKLQDGIDYMGEEKMNQYRDIGGERGTALHDLTVLVDKNESWNINFDKLKDPVLCNLNAFISWQVANVIKPVVIEKKFFHDKYLYCGTPDRVYKLINQDTLDLVDFKTGATLDMKKIRWQLSAYKEALRENNIKVVNRIVLHFVNGKIKPIYLDPRTHLSDFQSFLYAKESYMRYNINK